MQEMKLVMLGSGGVDKSALAVQFVQGVFVEKYDPTIEDSYRKNVVVDGVHCLLELLDTAGTEQFTAMRDLYMKDGQGFILCYSIVANSTFTDLNDIRDQIVRVKDTDEFPLMIVGTKCHLEDQRVVPRYKGESYAESLGGLFFECSAKTGKNIHEMFCEMVRLVSGTLPAEKKAAMRIRKDLWRVVNKGHPDRDDIKLVKDQWTCNGPAADMFCFLVSKIGDCARLAQHHPQDTLFQNFGGESALSYACRSGRLDVAKLLLNAPQLRLSSLSKLALVDAVREGHVDILKHAVVAGVDTIEALQEAFAQKKWKLVEILLDGFQLIEKRSQSTKQTAVELAIDKGFINAVQFFVQQRKGLVCLARALERACKKSQPEIAAFLVSKGAMNIIDLRGGVHPLKAAITSQSVECVRVLLAAGMDVSGGPSWSYGLPPVALAVEIGSVSVLSSLLLESHGWRLTTYYRLVLGMAVSHAGRRNLEVLPTLLEHGYLFSDLALWQQQAFIALVLSSGRTELANKYCVDLNQEFTFEGRCSTQLLRAIEKKCASGVAWLIQKGVDMDLACAGSPIPIVAAVNSNNREILSAVIQCADTAHTRQRGWSAVIGAVTNGDASSLAVLLEHGADIWSDVVFPGRKAQTILQLAIECRAFSCIAGLAEYGASPHGAFRFAIELGDWDTVAELFHLRFPLVGEEKRLVLQVQSVRLRRSFHIWALLSLLRMMPTLPNLVLDVFPHERTLFSAKADENMIAVWLRTQAVKKRVDWQGTVLEGRWDEKSEDTRAKALMEATLGDEPLPSFAIAECEDLSKKCKGSSARVDLAVCAAGLGLVDLVVRIGQESLGDSACTLILRTAVFREQLPVVRALLSLPPFSRVAAKVFGDSGLPPSVIAHFVESRIDPSLAFCACMTDKAMDGFSSLSPYIPASPLSKFQNGKSLLVLAAEFGNVETFRLLMAKYAAQKSDLTQALLGGVASPFWIACRGGWCEILQDIFQACSHISDECLDSGFLIATRANRLSAVKFLAERKRRGTSQASRPDSPLSTPPRRPLPLGPCPASFHSALCLAAKLDFTECVDFLLSQGASPISSVDGAPSAFANAVSSYSRASLRKLVQEKRALLSRLPPSVRLGIAAAYMEGSDSDLSLLKPDGAFAVDDVFSWKGQRVTLLECAIQLNNMDAIQCLVETHGASLLGTSTVRSPLQVAVELGLGSIVSFLLQKGANPLHDASHEFLHYTLLGIALKKKYAEISTLLLESISDVSALNESFLFGTTHLGLALQQNLEAQALELIRRGVSVQALSGGVSPMELAIRLPSHNAVCALLARDPSLVNLQLNANATPLPLSISLDDLAILRTLIEKGSNVEAAHGDELMTPLGSAIKQGKTAFVQALLEGKAHVEALSEGLCPLALCLIHGAVSEILLLLLQSGANANVLFQCSSPWAPTSMLGDLTSPVEVWTPLGYCIARKLRYAASILLNSGCVDLEKCFSPSRGPLSYTQFAVDQEEFLVCAWLMERGCPLPSHSAAKLAGIQCLDLCGGMLDAFPPGLKLLVKNMPALSEILLGSDNTFSRIPDAVKKEGPKAVWQYYSDVHLNVLQKNLWKQAKIMVLGQENVGKTYLLRRLQDPRFKGYKSLSTNGIDVHSIAISNVELTWFDFGGQSVFYPTHQFFLTEHCVYLLVFRLDDPATEERLAYWLQTTRSYARFPDRPIKIVIVGTCSDLVAKRDFFGPLQSLISLYGSVVACCAVSCETGAGFPELRQAIEMAVKAAKLGELEVPSYYQKLSEWMRSNAAATPKLTFEVLQGRLGAEMYTDTRLRTALGFLHTMGLCFYNKRLGVVILNPQWLADMFSALITMKHNWLKNGAIARADLPHVWKGTSELAIEENLTLLKLFEIAFERRDGFWVVPSLLPDSAPGGVPSLLSQNVALRFARVYSMEFLPHGTMGRLLVRLQAWSDVTISKLWRHGVCLQTLDRLEEALLELKVDSRSVNFAITCVVHGHRPLPELGRPPNRLLIQRLAEEAGSLLKTIFRQDMERARDVQLATGTELHLPFREWICCPHCLEKNVVDPHRLLIHEAIQLVLNGEPSFACGATQVSTHLLGPDITFGYVQCFDSRSLTCEAEPFAQGGFGRIYKARVLGRFPACAKELLPEKVVHGFNEFQAEVSLMSSLVHPNLVSLYGITLQPLRMVMELCPHGDLQGALREELFAHNLQLQLKVALDIVEGMYHLHSQSPPIAHRDLRSPNILLISLDSSSEVCAKVGDLGLSCNVSGPLSEALSTWQWMAPEAQMGERYTEHCDLYSCAIVFSEIFQATGSVPFSEYAGKMREMEITQKLHHEGLRPTLPDHVPGWTRQLIERLWAHTPSSRPSFYQCLAGPAAMYEKMGISRRRLPNQKPGPSIEVVASTSNHAILWKHVQEWDDDVPVCLTGAGGLVWVGLRGGCVGSYRVGTGETVGQCIRRHDHTLDLCVLAGGEACFSGGKDGFIRFISLEELRESSNSPGPLGKKTMEVVKFTLQKTFKSARRVLLEAPLGSEITCLAFCGDLLFCGDRRGKVTALEGSSLKIIASVSLAGTNRAAISCMCYVESPDMGGTCWVGSGGDLLAVRLRPGSDKLTASIVTLKAHIGFLNALIWTGPVVWTASGVSIKIWEVGSRAFVKELMVPSKILCLSLVTTTTFGRAVWAGSTDCVFIYDAASYTLLHCVPMRWSCDVLCIYEASRNVWLAIRMRGGKGALIRYEDIE